MTKDQGQTKTILVAHATLATTRIFSWILISVCVFPQTVLAQSSTYARLVGTIEDQSGAIVPGVEVTATAKATNIPTMTITNDRGDYLIDKLKAGLYDIKAELPGFKTSVSMDIRLEVTQVARADLVMTLNSWIVSGVG